MRRIIIDAYDIIELKNMDELAYKSAMETIAESERYSVIDYLSESVLSRFDLRNDDGKYVQFVSAKHSGFDELSGRVWLDNPIITDKSLVMKWLGLEKYNTSEYDVTIQLSQKHDWRSSSSFGVCLNIDIMYANNERDSDKLYTIVEPIIQEAYETWYEFVRTIESNIFDEMEYRLSWSTLEDIALENDMLFTSAGKLITDDYSELIEA